MPKGLISKTGKAGLSGLLFFMALVASSPGQDAAAPALPARLKAMKAELGRNFDALQKEAVPPYYMSYAIDEVRTQSLTGVFGGILSQTDNTSAVLQVGMRTGDYKLDNTHEVRGGNIQLAALLSNAPSSAPAPLGESEDALSAILWRETDKAYKSAVEKLSQVKAAQNVQTAAADQSDDFSRAEPQTFLGKPADVRVDLEKWAARVRKFSAQFKGRPSIDTSAAVFKNEVRNKYFVNTDGAVLLVPANYMNLSITANAKADDGMELPMSLSYFGRKESDLPSEEKVLGDIAALIDTLEKLRAAPVADPYSGPAVLSGKASGVFFHEVLGHRLEGHRLKQETDGQTFKKKVGEQILPPFLSVFFDPTLRELDKVALSGAYDYDDEGVKAEKVVAVDGGVLKDFLMSRTPMEGFARSNGHGRAQPGSVPVSRQSNLVVESTNKLPESKLRQMLVEECKKQGKPYGLLVTEISGGVTQTGRGGANVFEVQPTAIYRVYADGRPDELVRGVNLTGTPLAAFGKILATGDRREVFNGTCGAESGSVPVSAAAPSILISEIELKKTATSQDKPPILPPPDTKTRKGGKR